MARVKGNQMRGQTVRFSDRQWALIQNRAEAIGLSASQYVRDVTWAAAVWDLARELGVDAHKASDLDSGLAPSVDRAIGFTEPARSQVA